MPNAKQIFGNATINSTSKRARNQSQQDASSATSLVLKRLPKNNQEQQNNNITSSAPNKRNNESNNATFEIANQGNKKRNDDINNPTLENENTTSLASSTDHGSDDDLVPLPVSSSSYKNNDAIRPLLVFLSVHRNDNVTPLPNSLSVCGDDIILSSLISSLGDLQPKRPAQFQQTDNEFEIALWLAHFKRILDLANSIRNGMMTKIDDKKQDLASTPLHDSISKLLEIDHIRNMKLSNEFKLIYKSEFISDNIWKQLLQMYLKATDQKKLKKNSAICTKLGGFVHQVVKAILITQDDEKDTQNVIRKFDEYTIDLEIPTKLGIIGLLPVQELLE
ncbi:119_t:CDS:2 [Dentiscutata erythropus]|uniref:119_t:CDS:1 n=1 Tax=Dentiscutata erythropus TaxID=1348616 RepID=A0A9N9C969_9GLOM|nr:119_t:CDS:2 [Dentiscutata erythropus]